ncbi:hypothetical protein EDC01DRAFT_731400 [Geopyxis carbonaria]|nr:hypothetical protein EDC01DRAFT_731400 [Geopyxis carbonaria]
MWSYWSDYELQLWKDVFGEYVSLGDLEAVPSTGTDTPMLDAADLAPQWPDTMEGLNDDMLASPTIGYPEVLTHMQDDSNLEQLSHSMSPAESNDYINLIDACADPSLAPNTSFYPAPQPHFSAPFPAPQLHFSAPFPAPQPHFSAPFPAPPVPLPSTFFPTSTVLPRTPTQAWEEAQARPIALPQAYDCPPPRAQAAPKLKPRAKRASYRRSPYPHAPRPAPPQPMLHEDWSAFHRCTRPDDPVAPAPKTPAAPALKTDGADATSPKTPPPSPVIVQRRCAHCGKEELPGTRICESCALRRAEEVCGPGAGFRVAGEHEHHWGQPVHVRMESQERWGGGLRWEDEAGEETRSWVECGPDGNVRHQYFTAGMMEWMKRRAEREEHWDERVRGDVFTSMMERMWETVEWEEQRCACRQCWGVAASEGVTKSRWKLRREAKGL